MARKKTQEEFNEEVFNLVGEEYTFMEQYKGNGIKIKVRHNSKECNNEYMVKPNSFLSGRRCPYCSNKKRKFKGKMTSKEWKDKINKHAGKEYTLITENEFDSSNFIELKHNSCGNIIRVKPNDFLRNTGCRQCSHKKVTKKFTKTDEEFKEEVKNLVGHEYQFMDTYKNTYTPLKVIHTKCQGVYKVAPRDFLKGLRCSVCSSSRGEKTLVEYFNKRGILYERQKTYDDLIYIRKMYFDFYLPEFNTIIEYHGKQHYEPIEFFGGEEVFKEQKKRDLLKKEYAIDKGINFIEIPYTYKTTKHIEKFLDKLLLL